MALFSCGLLGTLLLLSSFHSLAFSVPSRRLLATSSTVIRQYLAPHNAVRSKLGLPPLQWSEALASYASWWAHQRRGDCALIHSSSDYGENLFWGGGHAWRPRDAVAAWAAEGPYYDYGTNTCAPNRDCTHYTQVVWRQSLRIGCARVICVNGDTFITCNYDPHGNVIGQRPY
ncbi:pathogenesis-related protein 1 [Syzygium oleosum]|uniref:pathogenesis-related protein 1 n=1 Tax=Syzygium oleosum TaxID=219896 RepID=UPI0011D1D6E1|nr:pathogenesis-related protein 1 [Syzygium oleosum]